jgi:hypothetical protein
MTTPAPAIRFPRQVAPLWKPCRTPHSKFGALFVFLLKNCKTGKNLTTSIQQLTVNSAIAQLDKTERRDDARHRSYNP